MTSHGWIVISTTTWSWDSLNRLTISSTAGRSASVKPFQNVIVVGPPASPPPSGSSPHPAARPSTSAPVAR